MKSVKSRSLFGIFVRCFDAPNALIEASFCKSLRSIWTLVAGIPVCLLTCTVSRYHSGRYYIGTLTCAFTLIRKFYWTVQCRYRFIFNPVWPRNLFVNILIQYCNIDSKSVRYRKKDDMPMWVFQIWYDQWYDNLKVLHRNSGIIISLLLNS